MATPTTWTDGATNLLIHLWFAGDTASEIARLLASLGLDVSRNAVIGKAHRLGLPGRPSPLPRSRKGVPVAARNRASAPVV